MKPGHFSKTAFLYLLRSWRATLVLSVMVVSAVALLVFLASLAVGTNDAMIRNSVGLFSGHIAGNDLPGGMDVADLYVQGVRTVLVRRVRPVRLQHGDRAQTITLHAVDPVQEQANTAIWKKTVAGRYLSQDAPGIYLSEATAEALRVDVDQIVRVDSNSGLQPRDLKVCGIYRTGVANLDHGAGFVSQTAVPLAGGSLQVAVFLEDGADPRTVVASYGGLSYQKRLSPWMDFFPDLKQLVELNFVSMGIVMVLVFGVVALGISCAFVIFILKNIREHGVMKAMGVLPEESAFFISAQVAIMTGAAAAVGTAAGALAVALFAKIGIDLTALTSHNQYFAVSGVIYPRLTPFSLWFPPLLAIVFGLLAAVWPSLLVIRQRAAEILRSL